MKRLQTIEADNAAEQIEGVAVARFRRDVVTGRDEMARVEADADAH